MPAAWRGFYINLDASADRREAMAATLDRAGIADAYERFLAAGATPNLTLNPLESIQTMTAYIVQVSLGDTPAGGIEYKTIFAVGALLFVITLGMNVMAHKIMRRYREVYE